MIAVQIHSVKIIATIEQGENDKSHFKHEYLQSHVYVCLSLSSSSDRYPNCTLVHQSDFSPLARKNEFLKFNISTSLEVAQGINLMGSTNKSSIVAIDPF